MIHALIKSLLGDKESPKSEPTNPHSNVDDCSEMRSEQKRTKTIK